jgi:hypothetical protein
MYYRRRIFDIDASWAFCLLSSKSTLRLTNRLRLVVGMAMRSSYCAPCHTSIK